MSKCTCCVLYRDMQRSTGKEERFKRHAALIKNNAPVSRGQGQLQELSYWLCLLKHVSVSEFSFSSRWSTLLNYILHTHLNPSLKLTDVGILSYLTPVHVGQPGFNHITLVLSVTASGVLSSSGPFMKQPRTLGFQFGSDQFRLLRIT